MSAHLVDKDLVHDIVDAVTRLCTLLPIVGTLEIEEIPWRRNKLAMGGLEARLLLETAVDSIHAALTMICDPESVEEQRESDTASR